jgi:uncharacterized protein YbjT (DUF2867 family)
MAPRKTYVVAGATGWQGGATARHLKKEGHRVIGITHTRAKAPKLEAMGIEPLVADLRDAATLVPHLRGVDGLFLVTDPFARRAETKLEADWVADEVRQGREALSAARGAEVPHVVLSSVTVAALDHGYPIHKSKIPIEREAKDLGLTCTTLRPPWFMDDWVFDVVEKTPVPFPETGQMGFPSGGMKADTPLPHIATDDLGRVAAWAFDHPDQSAGQIWEVVGEVTTYPAIARTLSRMWGKPVIFSEVPPTEDDFLLNPALVRREYVWDVDQWERKFGFRMITFDEFVDRLAAVP